MSDLVSSKVKSREGPAQDEVVRFEKAAGGADGAWLGMAIGAVWFAGALFLNLVSPDLSLIERMSGLAPPGAILLSCSYFLARRTPSRVDTLSLNDWGISIIEGDRCRSFAWTEISRVRKYIDDDGESATEVVAIERKGELNYIPALGDVRGFSVSADELVGLIRRRKALADAADANAWPRSS